MDVLELRRRIPTKHFDYQKLMAEAQDQSHPRRFVGTLVKKGHILRIKKGLYAWSATVDPAPLSKEVLANLIYGPSYVSLEYALAFYGLIPERVEALTSVTVKKSNRFETPVGNFTYDHLHEATYSLGIRLHVQSKQISFLIATPEKALLDVIALRSLSVGNDLREFLEGDLRIDLEEFEKLDQSALKALAIHYKSRAVKEFMKQVKHG